MADSAHNFRGKLNAQGFSLNTTPSNSPLSRQVPRSPQRINAPAALLSLRTVVGTTTETPNGFSCHPSSDNFAICAGSAAILANVDANGLISQRFFRARPSVGSVNPVYSFYDTAVTGGTPDGRRKTGLGLRSAVFGVGPTGSPRRDWNDDNGSKSWTARERVKATSSVSISHDGHFLAVGETGYCPRVLIFSTAEDAVCDIPLSIITEHTFGIRAVAFSPDSRYLATLGEANDGFLFMWTFDAKTGAVKLHSTNKCTANIYDMAWCGESLITVGTRHVKVWRLPVRPRASPTKARGRRPDDSTLASPAPQALLGRNCLLGALADSTFTCITAISEHEAIVCTDSGQACTVRGSESVQEIRVSRQVHFRIYAVTAKLSTGQVLFGGVDGALECADFETLRGHARPVRRPSSVPQSPASNTASPKAFSPRIHRLSDRTSRSQRCRTIAIGWLRHNIVSIDSNYHTHVLTDEDGSRLRLRETFESHHEAIQGINNLANDTGIGAFFTWSQSGKVHFWHASGKIHHSRAIAVESLRDEVDEIPNELKVVQASADASHFISGDKLGVLKVVRGNDWTVLHELRAHGAEISDIALYGTSQTQLVATCGRDRVVQLFALTRDPDTETLADTAETLSSEAALAEGVVEPKFGTIELLQTMEDHVGAVGHVLFTNDGGRLLSCSADRTVIVRDRVMKEPEILASIAYIGTRIITLKSSPVSMATVPGEDNTLVVSTMDRQVLKLDLTSGAQVESFKITDFDSDDTAIMNSIQVSKKSTSLPMRLLIGSSSSDKSIRVYDYDQNILLAREAGHMEGISGLVFNEGSDAENEKTKRSVVSSGLDGTIMIWDLVLRTPPPLSTPLQELTQGQALQIYDADGVPPGAPTALRQPLRRVLSRSDLADFSILDPTTKSVTLVRDQSPPRIRRKTSKFSLAPPNLGLTDSPSLPPLNRSVTGVVRGAQSEPERDRSPSPIPIMPPRRSARQRSPTNYLRSTDPGETSKTRRSPSPPSLPRSVPNTPRTTNRANNSQLRRPPSIPSNLRSHTTTPGRRKSLAVSTSTDPNNTGLASQQLSRSLRSYRKKINAVEEQVELEEVETELLATLQSVREKKVKSAASSSSSVRAKAAIESDLNSLAALMEKTGVS